MTAPTRVELGRAHVSYRMCAAWVIGTFLVSIIVISLTLPDWWGAWRWLPTLALWALLLYAPKYLEARMNGSGPGSAYFSRPGGGFVSAVDPPTDTEPDAQHVDPQPTLAAVPADPPEHPMQEVAVVVFARVPAVDMLDGETLAARAVRKAVKDAEGGVEVVAVRELALAVGDTMLMVVPTAKAFRGQS